MAQVELAPKVADDLDRIVEHLEQHQVVDLPERIEGIMRAIDVLEHNPLIGRAVKGDLRELVIGRRARGYVALYRFVAEVDTVYVLAIRGQKEAGHTEE